MTKVNFAMVHIQSRVQFNWIYPGKHKILLAFPAYAAFT